MKTITINDDGNMKTSEIIAECRKKFDVWVYDEEKLDTEFPVPKKPTSRSFKYTQEADEELKNLSANDLKKKEIEGITLRERLLMERAYFKKTGKHLDIESVTLCSGSRYSDGSVPYVYWHSDSRKMSVDWDDPSYSYAGLRSRAAVTLDSSSSDPSDLEQRVAELEAWKEKVEKIAKEIIKSIRNHAK